MSADAAPPDRAIRRAAFEKTVPVRFEDCDPAGIVFYPRYFYMINRLVEDLFEERLDYPWRRLHGVEHRGVPAVRIEIDFTRPSRQGDLLTFALDVVEVGRSAFTVRIDARCDGETRLACRMVLAYTTAGAEIRPLPMPESLRDGLLALKAAAG